MLESRKLHLDLQRTGLGRRRAAIRIGEIVKQSVQISGNLELSRSRQ
jgi:hypothetical protein